MRKYIQSEEHFINYINSILSSNSEFVDHDKLMTSEFYVEHIYKAGLADKYMWQVRTDFSNLYEENILNFINFNNTISYVNENLYTKDFINFISALHNIPGVYVFETIKKKPLYIGMSINLHDRAISSFNERFLTYNKRVYLKCIKCNSAIDAGIVEVYLIGKLKPPLNVTSKYFGDTTVIVSNIPPFTKRILCKSIVSGGSNDK